MEATRKYFHVVDFVIFVGMLLFSAAIGIFFAYRDRGRQSTDNYYFGGGKISPIPVAISLSVSFVSAITVIGYPVEVYLYGTVFAWIVFAQFLAATVCAVYFIPLIHGLKLKSIYEFLELRYHRSVRTTMCTIGIVQLIFYMGITVYLPSLALSAVTPLSITWSIALTSVVCTFYTTLGGMKAVIWTDVLQSLVMLTGMVSVFARTIVVLGGFGELASATQRGGRNNFLKFDMDPRIRSTAWTVGLGFAVNECCVRSCNQVCVQRYLSCRSIRDARKALYFSLLPTSLLTLLAVGCGLAMYAYFEDCDPLLAGVVEKSDQIMPMLAVEVFQDIPGMAGLFVSAAYCGTLSSISSGVNALAALCLMDFILPCFPSVKSRNKMVLNHILSIFFGAIVMIVAYVISFSSSNIIQISFSIFGSIAGPVIGLYCMGAFMPWTNYKGALAGVFSAWIITAWIGLSATSIVTYIGTREKLPSSTTMCNISTTLPPVHEYSSTPGWPEQTTGQAAETHRPLIYDTLYSLSPFSYAAMGYLTCIVVGNLMSFVTGAEKPSEADPKLFVPLMSGKIWPKCVVTFFRFGVPDASEKKETAVIRLEDTEPINEDRHNLTESPLVGSIAQA